VEYFIKANSFAAPFVSDTSTDYVEADSPKEALEKFAKDYGHPSGLFAAACYKNADAMHKGEKPLAKWLCNQQIAIDQATEGLGAYSIGSEGPGKIRINDTLLEINKPKEGRVV
jgi:hypothetical protein